MTGCACQNIKFLFSVLGLHFTNWYAFVVVQILSPIQNVQLGDWSTNLYGLFEADMFLA